MRSVQKVSTTVRGVFEVFDDSDTPITGLVDGDFTKRLTKDGANSAVSVTVAEVANGRYTYTFTPNATGHWQVWIVNDTYNDRGWIEDHDVTTNGILLAAAGDQMALTTAERDSVADALLDLANGVEAGYTLRQALRLMAAVIAGKASGGPTNSVFRNLPDTADRVTSVADSNGDRSAVTYNP